MKRTITTILLLGLSFALFTNCGDTGGAGGTKPDNGDKTPPTISSAGASPTSITLPGEITSVTLTVIATSADETAIKSIAWTVIDSPTGANPTIANPSTASATANGMTVAGTYQFRVTVTGNNDVQSTQNVTVIANLDATVDFSTLESGTSLNFAPIGTLPAGVTYTLTDDKGNSWNSASGFNGQVNASNYSADGPITFTQTFYLNGTEITGTGSKRTVAASVSAFFGEFMTIASDTGSVTLKYP